MVIHQRLHYKVGDRIGQVYLEEVIPIEFEEVKKLSETKRGTGGFGSTNTLAKKKINYESRISRH